MHYLVPIGTMDSSKGKSVLGFINGVLGQTVPWLFLLSVILWSTLRTVKHKGTADRVPLLRDDCQLITGLKRYDTKDSFFHAKLQEKC